MLNPYIFYGPLQLAEFTFTLTGTREFGLILLLCEATGSIHDTINVLNGHPWGMANRPLNTG